MRLPVLLFSLIFCGLLSSCSPKMKLYDGTLHQKIMDSQQRVNDVQFYLEDDLVLRRYIDDDETRIKDGKVQINAETLNQRIVIRRKTPGAVVKELSNGFLAVSFEEDDNYFLVFGPERKLNGKYTLRAKKWERTYGLVNYGEGTYRISRNRATLGLMVNVKGHTLTKQQQREASGREVR